MPAIRGRRLFAVLAALAACGIVAYATVVYIPPLLRGSGCEARTPKGSVQLTLDQAENAATIAAVATREGLPRRAVTVALAAAFQESKLQNLPYGDRDSVGLFQQRPSQGWGRQEQLLDPVYATTQFYEALVDVEGYRRMPIHEAAQAVQRSADGSAYAQHRVEATILSTALTGRAKGGLRCWFRDPVGEFDFRGLRTQLIRQFGSSVNAQAADGGLDVLVPGKRRGWVIAVWAVANADDLGIDSVSYRNLRWAAEDGYDGWTRAEAPGGRVQIRGER